jgi:hypothetical protein
MEKPPRFFQILKKFNRLFRFPAQAPEDDPGSQLVHALGRHALGLHVPLYEKHDIDGEEELGGVVHVDVYEAAFGNTLGKDVPYELHGPEIDPVETVLAGGKAEDLGSFIRNGAQVLLLGKVFK